MPAKTKPTKPRLFRVGHRRRTFNRKTRVAENVTRAQNETEAKKQIARQRGVVEVLRVLPLDSGFRIVAEGEVTRPAALETGPDLPDTLAERRETAARSLNDPNKLYKFKYELVPLGSLKTSHDDNFNIRQDYPQELQPRQRDRAASKLQIGQIANTLSPEALLTDVQQLDRGPAIVGPDKAVESGNGRVMALRLARAQVPERWQDYQDTLRGQLDTFGFTLDEYNKIADPVLVRERLTPVNRPAFAAEANQSAVLTMSPLEQALQDSQRVSPAALQALVIPQQSTASYIIPRGGPSE